MICLIEGMHFNRTKECKTPFNSKAATHIDLHNHSAYLIFGETIYDSYISDERIQLPDYVFAELLIVASQSVGTFIPAVARVTYSTGVITYCYDDILDMYVCDRMKLRFPTAVSKPCSK